MDAQKSVLEKGNNLQINRTMYEAAVNHVINAVSPILSSSSSKRLTAENSPFAYTTFVRFDNTAQTQLSGNMQYLHGVIALVASWVMTLSPFPF